MTENLLQRWSVGLDAESGSQLLNWIAAISSLLRIGRALPKSVADYALFAASML
jgi:hypothetical protein